MGKTKQKRKLPLDRHVQRRVVVTLIMAVLLVTLYSLIFRFSAQDSEESGSLSWMLSKKCVELLNWLTGSGWSEVKTVELAGWFEYPLRKLAHFSEYACMGLLVYILWIQWLEQGKRLYFLVAIWVFLSAAADEFHQYFVPGRCASFKDVMIDTCGGIFGMLFGIMVYKLCQRRKMKREKHV